MPAALEGNTAGRFTRVLINRFPGNSARASRKAAWVPICRMMALITAVVLALKSRNWSFMLEKVWRSFFGQFAQNIVPASRISLLRVLCHVTFSEGYQWPRAASKCHLILDG